MREIKILKLDCIRCGYSWTPIHSPIVRCPKCKSKHWDTPKVRPVRLGKGLGIEEIVLPYGDDIIRISRKYGAKKVRVFGSVRRREADARSDLDLLVDWKKDAPPLARLDLEIDLERLIGRKVQVASSETIPRTFRDQVLSEAVGW
jgi:hypothetical protein